MTTRQLNSRRASLLLLVAIIVQYTTVYMTKNCFSSAMVFIVDEGLLTKLQTGTITAVFYLIYAVLQVVGGVFIDKWHPERFITAGLIGAAVVNLTIYLNQNYVVMLVAWALNAIVQFGVWPATFKLVSTMLSDDTRDYGLFAVSLISSVSLILGYVVAAIVGEAWRLNFLISAIMLVTVSILWEAVMRGVKPYIVEIESHDDKVTVGEKVSNKEFFGIAMRGGVALIFVIALIRTMFDVGLKGLTATMINESYSSVTPVLATLLGIIVLVSGALGPIIARVVYPRFIQNEAVAIVVFLASAVPFIVLTLFIGKIPYGFIVAALAFILMLTGSSSLFTTSYISSRFNKWGRSGTVAGIINCGASLGVVASNTLFTAVADHAGWSVTAILWLALILFVLTMAIIFVPIWTKFRKNQ